MLEEAPKHGVVISLSKWCAYMPPHMMEDKEGMCNHDLWSFLQSEGMREKNQSTAGLYRMLGAPIGTSAFCSQQDGMIERVTSNAVEYVKQIGQLENPQAQYLMLHHSARCSLSHLPRLIKPQILSGYALRHQQALHEGVRSVLKLQQFSEFQRTRIALPLREGGIGIVSAYDTLVTGWVAAHGDISRWLKKSVWKEAGIFLAMMPDATGLRGSVSELNEILMRHEQTIRIKPLDPLLPWTWPKSKDLSRVTHRVAADELEQELMQDSKPGNKIALSWFRSCRLHGAMDWLRTIPRFHTFRVSQALWRVMFATTMCAPVVSSMMNLVCPCGNDSQLLRYGIHWYAQCNAVTLKTTRHNVVADVLRQLFKAAGWITIDGEAANWVPGRKDKRPFDVCAKQKLSDPWTAIDLAVMDPTRIGKIPTGQYAFKPGQAAAQEIIRKKKALHNLIKTYGAIKQPITYTPVAFEVTGGFGTRAKNLLESVISSMSGPNAAKTQPIPEEDQHWTSPSYAAYWRQRFSFSIAQFTAMSVLQGVAAAVKEFDLRKEHHSQ
jgi:hypothetical protein